MGTPQLPPEATLIRRRREEPPNMSVRSAAASAGISPTRWAQVESGAHAPAQTIAAMAAVVGVTAAELRTAGREDAAAELEAMPPREPEPQGGDDYDDLERQARALLNAILRQRRQRRQGGDFNAEVRRFGT